MLQSYTKFKMASSAMEASKHPLDNKEKAIAYIVEFMEGKLKTYMNQKYSFT